MYLECVVVASVAVNDVTFARDVSRTLRFAIAGVAVDDVTLAHDVTVTYLERLVVAGVAVDDVP